MVHAWHHNRVGVCVCVCVCVCFCFVFVFVPYNFFPFAHVVYVVIFCVSVFVTLFKLFVFGSLFLTSHEAGFSMATYIRASWPQLLSVLTSFRFTLMVWIQSHLCWSQLIKLPAWQKSSRFTSRHWYSRGLDGVLNENLLNVGVSPSLSGYVV